MWAICGSVGFAPCAKAAPLNRLTAAIAALNRMNMVSYSSGAAAQGRPALLVEHRSWMEQRRERSRKLCGHAQSFQDRLGQPLAALAREWKGFQHDRADFPFHVLPQHGAGPVQPRLHGFRLQVEQ